MSVRSVVLPALKMTKYSNKTFFLHVSREQRSRDKDELITVRFSPCTRKKLVSRHMAVDFQFKYVCTDRLSSSAFRVSAHLQWFTSSLASCCSLLSDLCETSRFLNKLLQNLLITPTAWRREATANPTRWESLKLLDKEHFWSRAQTDLTYDLISETLTNPCTVIWYKVCSFSGKKFHCILEVFLETWWNEIVKFVCLTKL